MLAKVLSSAVLDIDAYVVEIEVDIMTQAQRLDTGLDDGVSWPIL